MNWIEGLILAGVFQGTILFIALLFKKDGQKKSRRYLTFLLALITVSLFSRFAYLKGWANELPRLALIPDTIIFVFGPTLYLYILTLIANNNQKTVNALPHYMLGIAHIIFLLFLVLRPNKSINLLVNSGELLTPMYIIMWFGIFICLLYVLISYYKIFIFSKDLVRRNKNRPRLRYLVVILSLITITLSISMVSYTTSMLRLGSPDLLVYRATWIFLTFTIYALAFFAISNPRAVFLEELKTKYKNSRVGNLELEELKNSLTNYMVEKKPYLNPKITLNDLAAEVNLNTSDLSRVINDGFNKNFFDFVNEYRVNEFINLVQNPIYSKYTFIAISKEAGFNSKSTFNAAFKKVTGKSPREFLSSNSELKEY